MILSRRAALLGLGAAMAAPAIVKIENVMYPVRRPHKLLRVYLGNSEQMTEMALENTLSEVYPNMDRLQFSLRARQVVDFDRVAFKYGQDTLTQVFVRSHLATTGDNVLVSMDLIKSGEGGVVMDNRTLIMANLARELRNDG
jgi:hypothetical protein